MKSSSYRSARTKRSRHQKRKRRTKVKDQIKTGADVRKAVQETAPSQGKLDTISGSITTTPVTLLEVSKIAFNNDDAGQYERNSKKITMGSLRFRGTLVVGDATNLVRLLVVRDKNQDNQAWDPNSCFFSDGNVVPAPTFAQINTRNVDVLYDNTYNMQDSTESVPAVRPSQYFVDFYVPIRKTLTYIQQNAGDAAINPRNGHHYYLVAVSDSSILPNPSIRGSSATWFKNIK